jgi:hypothetical protein
VHFGRYEQGFKTVVHFQQTARYHSSQDGNLLGTSTAFVNATLSTWRHLEIQHSADRPTGEQEIKCTAMTSRRKFLRSWNSYTTGNPQSLLIIQQPEVGFKHFAIHIKGTGWTLLLRNVRPCCLDVSEKPVASIIVDQGGRFLWNQSKFFTGPHGVSSYKIVIFIASILPIESKHVCPTPLLPHARWIAYVIKNETRWMDSNLWLHM